VDRLIRLGASRTPGDVRPRAVVFRAAGTRG